MNRPSIALALLLAGLIACSPTGARAPDDNRRDAGTTPDVSAASDFGMLGDSSNRRDLDHDATASADAAPDVTDLDLGELVPIPLQSTIDRVQPMTGIVLWENSWNEGPLKTDAVQLEYAYVSPATIVIGPDTYDWSAFETFLDRVAARENQAIVRFYYVYPGRETEVPQYIKDRSDYIETEGQTEGQTTWFPDWSNAELQRAHLAFYAEFASKYDDDPRIAFLQVGFGLWGEYHIYDGPNEIGAQFPSKAFQADFLRHLATVLTELRWSVSIDAGDDTYSPFADDAQLLALDFGNFDDSFMHEQHSGYNETMWNFFGHEQRYAIAPHGGELSYYTQFDQENALDPAGLHGRTYEQLSAKFHISYMIGNDQPDEQSAARILEAGLANGYRFEVTEFAASATHTRVTVENAGIAPIYYDAFAAVNGVRSSASLRGLLPGDSITALIPSGGTAPRLTIECDRLVPGQEIQFSAALP